MKNLHGGIKRKVSIFIIIITLITLFLSANVQANPGVSAPPVHPEPFKIGVVDSSIGESAVGRALSESIRGGDQSVTILDNETNIPESINSVWVSSKHLHDSNTKQLFKEAKNQQKPFYIYGDGLNIKEINDELGVDTDLDARIENKSEGPDSAVQRFDMVGFKFENGQTIPSFVISMNKGSAQPSYDLEGLKKHARYYDIKIQRTSQPKLSLMKFFSPKIAEAAGMSVNLPSSFSQVYVWEATIYNWIWVNSTTSKRASTYHVYEVYKDPTTSNPDTKSYSTFRLDTPHLDSCDRFFSKNALYSDGTGSIITANYEPENTTFNGSVTFNLAWPPSASVSFSSSADVEIYNSTIDWAGDNHSFYAEDNEYLDTLLRPGDSWVANLGYHVPEKAAWHEWGQYVSHQKEGVWDAAVPSDYNNMSIPYYRSYNTTVIWRLSR